MDSEVVKNVIGTETGPFLPLLHTLLLTSMHTHTHATHTPWQDSPIRGGWTKARSLLRMTFILCIHCSSTVWLASGQGGACKNLLLIKSSLAIQKADSHA